MLGSMVTLYLFLGGAGAGALAVLGTIEGLLTLRSCPAYLRAIPQELLAKSWIVCFAALAIGIACLALDLGRFDRLLVLVVTPQPTAIALGAVALAFALALAGIGAVCENVDGVHLPVFATRVFALMAIAVSAVAMSYTGVLLQSMASVVAWQTPLIPVLFVCSSVSCGIALIVGTAAFVEPRGSVVAPIRGMLGADSVLIVLEGVALCAFLLHLSSDERAIDGLTALLSGSLAPVFWGVLCFMGLVVPFLIERFVANVSHHFVLAWIAAALLAGGFALRVCVVGLQGFDPTAQFAAMAYSSGELAPFM